jgi:hypothetical protein
MGARVNVGGLRRCGSAMYSVNEGTCGKAELIYRHAVYVGPSGIRRRRAERRKRPRQRPRRPLGADRLSFAFALWGEGSCSGNMAPWCDRCIAGACAGVTVLRSYGDEEPRQGASGHAAYRTIGCRRNHDRRE